MDKTMKTPLEDLRKQALEHYEEAAKAIVHYNSFVRDAIMAYDPEQKLQHGVSGKRPDKEEIEKMLDQLLIARGEHPMRVRNPLYIEERELAKSLVNMICASGAVDTVAARRTWRDECREAGQDCGCGDICMFAPSARKSSEGQP